MFRPSAYTRRHLGSTTLVDVMAPMAMTAILFCFMLAIWTNAQHADTLGFVAEQTVDGVVVERHKLSSTPRTEQISVGSGRSAHWVTVGVWVHEPDGTDRLLDMADGTTLDRFGKSRLQAWNAVVERSPIGYALTTQEGRAYVSSSKPRPEQGGFEIHDPRSGNLHLAGGLKVRTFVTGQEEAWTDYVAKTDGH